MADAQANINVNLNTSEALASLRALQGQVASFHSAMAKGNANAVAESARMQKNLMNGINATGRFSAQMTTVASTTESFTRALEGNKLSMREYFRYAGGASRTFGRFFRNEFATIDKVARERLKSLQTQYIKMGRDASGAMKAIAVRPLALDMKNLATQTAMAAQKQQLLNQLIRQGSTNLLNWGKNTQWAGRQLMVGFTIPLTIFGTVAAKTFMDLEEQAIRFKRVYGELFTTQSESDAMFDQLKALGKEFTRYGVALEETMAMAADAAAMGKMGADLLAQVNEASKLAVLGGVEQEEALETTISLTNAFGVAANDLANEIDFLNAVENQTVVSIEDLTVAIPKAGPVVKQLGGDVKDLAFFLTAMKEGGINASEGANALKSGIGRIINPTKQASEMLAELGINVSGIVESNAGDIRATLVTLATELDNLDPLNRARAIEELFGKFQFARISTLFQNIVADGSQASRVLDLAKASTEELAILTERELKRVEDSPLYKFKQAWEDLQVTLVPIGKAFLEAVTPLVNFGADVLEKFDQMGDGAKRFTTLLVAGLGVIAPVLLMTVGLIGNGVANLMKFGQFLAGLGGAASGPKELGMQTQYMTQEQIEANTIAASLNQTHQNLRQTFTSEATAVAALTAEYRRAVTAQSALLATGRGKRMKPPGMRTGGIVKKYAKGVTMVPGPKGAGDVVPAMLSPGEAVIPVEETKRYFPLIQAMIAGAIPGFAEGFDGDINKLAKRLTGVSNISKASAEQKRQLDQTRAFVQKLSAAGDTPTLNELASQAKKVQSGAKSPFTATSLKRTYGLQFSHTAGTTSVTAKQAAADFGDSQTKGAVAARAIAKEMPSAKLAYGGASGFYGPAVLNRQTQTSGGQGALASEYRDFFKNTRPETLFGETFKRGGAQGSDARLQKVLKNAFVQAFDEADKAGKKVFDEVPKGRAGVSLSQIERTALSKVQQADPKAYARLMQIQRTSAGTPQSGKSGLRFPDLPKNVEAKVNAELKKRGFSPLSASENLPKTKAVTKRLLAAYDKNVKAVDNNTKAVNEETETKKTTTKKTKTQAKKAPATSDKRPKTIIGDDGREKVLRGNKYVDKIRSDASKRAAQTRVTNAEEQERRREARNARRRERYAEQRAARQAASAEASATSQEEQKQRRGLGGGARMGIGMALSSAAIAGSMAPGKVGERAQDLIMPAIVISSLLMLPPKIMLVVGALGAFGYGLYKVYDGFNDAVKAGQDMVTAMGATKESMIAFSEASGNVTAGEIMSRRREDAFSRFQVVSGKSSFGESFVQSEAGESMLNGLRETIESGEFAQLESMLTNKMATAVASGALSAGQARSVVAELSKELNDYGLGIRVNGELIRLLGPNGENLMADPLQVRLEIIGDTQEQMRVLQSGMGELAREAGGYAAGTAALGTGAGALAGVGMKKLMDNAIKKQATGVIARMAASRLATIAGGSLIGGPVGLAVGAIASVAMTAWDVAGAYKNIATQAGASAAISTMALEQQQEMLDSLDIEYEKRIANAKAAGDMAAVNQLILDQEDAKQGILDAGARTMELALAPYQEADNFWADWLPDFLSPTISSMDKAVEESIRARFEGTNMAGVADAAIRAIDASALTDTQEYEMKLRISSGDFDPQTVLLLLDQFANDTGQLEKILSIATKFGGAEANRAIQIMNMFIDENGNAIPEQQTKFIADFSAKGVPQGKKYLDMFQLIQQTLEVLDPTITMEFFLENPEVGEEILNDINYLQEVSGGEAIDITLVQSVMQEGVWDAVVANQEYFESLPPVQQRIYLTTIATQYETLGTPEGRAAYELAKTQAGGTLTVEQYLGGDGADGGYMSAAYQATEASRYVGGEAPEPPETEEGGGSRDQSSILDDVLKKLRDYRDLQVGILKGWDNISAKLEELFGGDGGISGFRGLSQQMRDLGLGENFIEMVVGMSPEEYEKYKDGLFVFDEAGNLAGITTQARSLAKALDAITLGEFQNEQEGTLLSMQKQVAAARKLVSAGLDWSQAYSMAADAGLAAAIVAETNLNNIREIVALVKQTEQMTADQAAAQAVATANSATANLRKVQEFIGKNSSALTDRQKEAILNDEDLQRLVLNPSINPSVLRQALKDAENAAQLDLEIKKMTFTGLQEIFSDGFSKAMEAFAAKEQKIELDFQFATAGDQDIVQAAQRQIEDIRYLVDDLQADLTRIKYQEDEINDRYKDRVEALSEVSKLNEKLNAQQEAQLTVADALSRGDIAAAARAAQEYRAQLAEDNATQQKDELERQKEIEIAAVRGDLGRTRASIEAEILQYQKQILEIEEGQLEPAQQRIAIADRLRADNIASLTILGRTRLEWEAIKNRVDLAVTSSEDYINAMKEALGVVEDIVNYWDNLDDQEVKDLFANVKMKVEEFEGLGPAIAEGVVNYLNNNGPGPEDPPPTTEETPMTYAEVQELIRRGDTGYVAPQEKVFSTGYIYEDPNKRGQMTIQPDQRNWFERILDDISPSIRPGLQSFWNWGTGGDGVIGPPLPTSTIAPRTESGAIDYSQIPEPKTAGFAPEFLNPQKIIEGLGLVKTASADTMEAISSDADTASTNSSASISAIAPVFPNTVLGTASTSIGQDLPLVFSTAAADSEQRMQSLVTFLQTIPNQTGGQISQGLSEQFALGAQNAALALQGLIDWFTIQLPLSTAVPITQMIPEQFNTIFPMAEPGLTQITDWFNQMPETVKESLVGEEDDSLLSLFDDLVGKEGEEGGILGHLKRVTDWIESLPSIMEEAFKELAKILANAVISALNAVINNLKKFEIESIPEIGFSGSKPFSGLSTIAYLNKGGIVGGVGNTDIVPAMLTPGEFVVRKFAVSQFGVENLEAINSGSYNKLSSRAGASTSGNDSVYNYNLNVNVNSDSRPEDIARVVMSGIRKVEGRRIRSNAL